MSTPTWSKRASAICVATVRCQIIVYRRSWSRSSEAATRAGCRRIEVGRIASWASWALRERVLYRLGFSSAYPRPDPAPQDRRDLVADQPVQDPAGLLGVEQLEVDLAGAAESLEDRVPGDLGEGDPLGHRGVDVEEGRYVVGDRLALAVVVGREHEVLGPLPRLLQRGDVLLRVLGDLVGDLEVVLDVHAEVALREVTDVAVGGPDRELGTEVLLDRLRLGR